MRKLAQSLLSPPPPHASSRNNNKMRLVSTLLAKRFFRPKPVHGYRHPEQLHQRTSQRNQYIFESPVDVESEEFLDETPAGKKEASPSFSDWKQLSDLNDDLNQKPRRNLVPLEFEVTADNRFEG